MRFVRGFVGVLLPFLFLKTDSTPVSPLFYKGVLDVPSGRFAVRFA